MADTQETPPRKTRAKNVFPCGVHSQHNAARGAAETDTKTTQIYTRDDGAESPTFEDDSPTKPVPFKIEYFRIESDCDGGDVSARSAPARADAQRADPSWNRCLNIPFLPPPVPCENIGPQDPSKSTSRPGDPMLPDLRRVSEESRVNSSCESISRDTRTYETRLKYLVQSYSQESPRREKYLNSLNNDTRAKTDLPEHAPEIDKCPSKNNDLPPSTCNGEDSLKLDCPGPREVKLHIRGHSVPNFSLSTGNVWVGPSSRVCTILDHKLKYLSVFQSLRSPHLKGVGDLKCEDILNDQKYKIGMNEAGEGPDSLEERRGAADAASLSSSGSGRLNLFCDRCHLKVVVYWGSFLCFIMVCKMFMTGHLDEDELGHMEAIAAVV